MIMNFAKGRNQNLFLLNNRHFLVENSQDSHYKQVPAHVTQKIIAESKKETEKA
jgi:hypothetical protein